MKQLVAYFSASGCTARLAGQLAKAVGADIFEIAPKVPYTDADLSWMDKKSRSSLEMSDPASRPEIARGAENLADYDVIYLGFPIWWYVAPTIVNTFLESGDFSGKTIVLFATSGGSGMGKTAQRLSESISPDAKLIQGKVLSSHATADELKNWVATLSL